MPPPGEAPAQSPATPRLDDNSSEPKIPEVLPILPLRNLVLFPGIVAPLSIGRPDSVRLLEESLPKTKIIGILSQRVAEKDNPGPDDLYRVGTAAMDAVFSGAGAAIMAVAIMISTFGCNNGLILAGARVYYAMARD